jgi:hypothetical protein
MTMWKESSIEEAEPDDKRYEVFDETNARESRTIVEDKR